ncbi:sensor domain-containing diguanylate cyclase [Rhodoferax sp.]|uniref:sensor domain-containing diguanylate cyclase n=1 Tax=Rhodoferax sp. TaxID=50421 RepID=UPI0025F4F86C|nr:sensor domain-containing diguanylate cyclase [Rhodoferax sp.]
MNAQHQRLLPVLRYMVATLLLGPVFTLLALNPVLTDSPANFLGPPAFFMLGLVGWYLISTHRITAAIKLMMVGSWIAVTGIAFFSGGLRSPVMVFYPVLILATGWLDSAGSSKWMAGFSVIVTLALWLGEHLQWLPLQLVAPSAVYAFDQIMTSLLAAVVIVFVVQTFKLRVEELKETKNSLKKQALALQHSEDRYRTLIEWSPGAVLVHRLGKIVYANPAAISLFGAPDAAALLTKSTTALIHPEHRAAQAARMKSIINQEAIPAATESRFLRCDGTPIDVQVQGTAIDFDGEPAIQVSLHDITESKKLEREIRQLAFYDDLTRLPNRRMLDDRLRQVQSSGKRHGGYSALLFLDLDNFKPLNDTHGHALGDALLIDAAARLRKCVRESDTVARFGGDEFVVLIAELGTSQIESTVHALGIAEKIRTMLSEPYELNTQQLASANGCGDITHQCTVSLGVVVFAGDRTPPSELLKQADTAMYQAKDEGRNRVKLFKNKAGLIR